MVKKSYIKKYKRKFDIFKAILDKDDPVVVEIGAHYGEDTLRFLEVFEKARMYCFEPDPRNIEIFKQYVTNPRATLRTTALAASDGTAKFYQSYQETPDQVPEKYDWITLEDYRKSLINSSGCSSLKKGHPHLLGDPIVVQTERFDKWYNQSDLGLIDLVWIDVQGAERDVIEGMGDAIHNVRLIWVEYGELEYSGAMTYHETIALLKEKNFVSVPQLSDHGQSGDLLFKLTMTASSPDKDKQ